MLQILARFLFGLAAVFLGGILGLAILLHMLTADHRSLDGTERQEQQTPRSSYHHVILSPPNP